MIPGRAIKVRVGSKSTKTHTLFSGLLELQFGHPLHKSRRWLLTSSSSYLHFPNNAHRPHIWLTETFFLSVLLPVCSVTSRCWWDKFNVCVTPTPPALFLSVSNNNTITFPAVIRTSSMKAAAVCAVDGRCCMNSGEANLSPYIVVKLSRTCLLLSLLSNCPLLRASGRLSSSSSQSQQSYKVGVCYHFKI